MDAILKYPGAKWRLAPWIIEHIPPHESYLEPFFGSGAVFFNKERARIETINDLDGEVVNFFRVCRERPEELAAAISLTPWARDERDAAYAAGKNDDPVERARKFAVRCWMTFGAAPYKSNGWRHTTGKTKNSGPDNTKLWARVPQVIQAAAVRLLDAQIENKPAVDVIRAHNGSEVLIYADPPYVHATRTAHLKSYTCEMTDAAHIELLHALREHEGMVLLSGYDSEMYRELLPGWSMRTKNTTAERGAKKTECLWLNLAAEEALKGTR